MQVHIYTKNFTKKNKIDFANYWGQLFRSWTTISSDYSILICKGDRRFSVSQIKKGYYYIESFVFSAFCHPGCQNGGSCVAPFKCECPPGVTGAFCQECKYLPKFTFVYVQRISRTTFGFWPKGLWRQNNSACCWQYHTIYDSTFLV